MPDREQPRPTHAFLDLPVKFPDPRVKPGG
jgi:hypothetical protein